MPLVHPNPDLPALGIRQPWAELILRGIKTIEVRSQNTNIRGPIYLYASKKVSDFPAAVEAASRYGIEVESLPRGLIVGVAEIQRTAPSQPNDAQLACVPTKFLCEKFSWHLSKPLRFEKPLTIRFIPYGIWFYPWKRRPKKPSWSNRVTDD